MAYGIGIDASLELSFAEQRTLVAAAAGAGYHSAWAPSGPASRDGFQVCAQWNVATADVVDGGLPTGVAVIPAPVWSVPALVQQAGALSAITGGRFTLGLGTGGAYGADFREMYGMPAWPVVRMMREYLVALRGLLAGESVTLHGAAVNLTNLRMTQAPLQVPLYVAALGPQMLKLAGELADGVSLNWTAPAYRSWCREQIAAGAERSGRDPGQVCLSEYIRVCIDEDEERARVGFVRAFMGYALARQGASKEHGYRGHFARQGFDAVLSKIEEKRDAGAKGAELVDLFPPELLREMGYYGPAAGAPAALARLSEGLDLPIVRIVGSQPGLENAMATVIACQPIS